MTTKKRHGGSSTIHTRPVSKHAARPVRKGVGTSERPPTPEPYQAACPQHGGVGCSGAGGLIGIWKPPLIRGPPDTGPPP